MSLLLPTKTNNMTTALLIVNGLVISYKGDETTDNGVLTVTDHSTGEEEIIHTSVEDCANFIARSLNATDVDCENLENQLPDNLIPWYESATAED